MAVELPVERVGTIHVLGGDLVGVGQEIRRHTLRTQGAEEVDHLRQRVEDVREERAERGVVAAVSGGGAELGDEGGEGNPPGLEGMEERGLVEGALDDVGSHLAMGSQGACGAAVGDVDEHHAEVKDDGLVGLGGRCVGVHDGETGRRPSRARARVRSSACSRPVPAGRPWAMRLTRTPCSLRRRAR